ncbi:hypothetical protein CXU22_06275 [Akkermansia muciniphila]|jgi:hypothetical protein|uniref:Uncharacterized protein n=1 Tax=Akkermansia muciniphila TaxID=239935 RepID=A0A2N8HE44_9BACT|nr:hypothetical protein [Akkermansia muciniphila]PNC18234.1 hypothetical protein CXU22_06275 [Akkermansia muciniphila]
MGISGEAGVRDMPDFFHIRRVDHAPQGAFTEKIRDFLLDAAHSGKVKTPETRPFRHDWNEPLFPFPEQAARSMLYYLSRLSFPPEEPPSTFEKACMTS